MSSSQRCVCGSGQVGNKWRVKEPGLKALHARAVAAVECFEESTLQHVLRCSPLPPGHPFPCAEYLLFACSEQSQSSQCWHQEIAVAVYSLTVRRMRLSLSRLAVPGLYAALKIILRHMLRICQGSFRNNPFFCLSISRTGVCSAGHHPV